MDLKRCGYPAGGSLEFARLFKKKYISTGGKINFNKRVSKVIVKDNNALVIILKNGKKYTSDIIISVAAYGMMTFNNLLDGKYRHWVEPGGGIPTVFKSGRDLAQIICRKGRVKFRIEALA